MFSVIIPTFNRAKKLNRCLQSLVDQTFVDFEVIVCDDGSTDNTLEVVNTYKNKLTIKYFWEPNFGGPAKPRNVGIKNSSRDWICLLDSDDWWTTDKLLNIHQNLLDADVIYHDLAIRNSTNVDVGIVKGRHVKKEVFKDLMINGNAIPTSSVVMRKSIALEVGLFSEDINFIAVEDFDFFIRVSLLDSRFKYIEKSLGYYSIGDNISLSNKQILKEQNLFFKYSSLLEKKDFNKASYFHKFRNARSYHEIANFSEARLYYIKSMCSFHPLIIFKSIIGLFFSVFKIKI